MTLTTRHSDTQKSQATSPPSSSRMQIFRTREKNPMLSHSEASQPKRRHSPCSSLRATPSFSHFYVARGPSLRSTLCARCVTVAPASCGASLCLYRWALSESMRHSWQNWFDNNSIIANVRRGRAAKWYICRAKEIERVREGGAQMWHTEYHMLPQFYCTLLKKIVFSRKNTKSWKITQKIYISKKECICCCFLSKVKLKSVRIFSDSAHLAIHHWDRFLYEVPSVWF